MDLTFEWDEAKARENLKNHKVSFEETRTVFADPLSLTICDPEHSSSELRFVDIGLSARARLLVVVYTQRGGNIRIISSRRATRAERKVYEDYDR
jgi:hypothetical protein